VFARAARLDLGNRERARDSEWGIWDGGWSDEGPAQVYFRTSTFTTGIIPDHTKYSEPGWTREGPVRLLLIGGEKVDCSGGKNVEAGEWNGEGEGEGETVRSCCIRGSTGRAVCHWYG